MRGVPNALGPSLTLGLLGPSHQWCHKSWASLRDPPCAHGVAGTPQGEVRDSAAPKGKASEMDWDATDDPDNVAEDGWHDEKETPWTCITCKKYVKMKHLMKLWPRAQAKISGPRCEGLASSY